MKSATQNITIRISQLSNGTHEYRFELPAREIELGDEFQAPLSIEAELEKNNRQIYLTSTIQTSGMFECDRCLDIFQQGIKGTYSMFYVYNEPDSEKYADDEVRIITPETPVIDLTDDVRQTVMLSVPLKLLCTESCKGLCPHCGANRNQTQCGCAVNEDDSRWDDLKQLLND